MAACFSNLYICPHLFNRPLTAGHLRSSQLFAVVKTQLFAPITEGRVNRDGAGVFQAAATA